MGRSSIRIIPSPSTAVRTRFNGALEWALENVVGQPGLTISAVWEGYDTFAVEVDMHHLMQDGTEVDFPQVFIIESEHGQVTRWQSYLPFPPPADE